ncbi:glycosyltransferase family 2 protein [Flavobacterium johnsoniae]|jgi:glycosyltransferase involved in cell wall biosynthesis|uniref:Candidate beta-D-/alpha-L glycosyltransferase Glycosyltransferase family 2 n=1 Tax=Flavobacterium johnsoniae (strain ATCC 17061 / DSM 2064 / JCM 8514 / BCRC 14874 / CCUG 350202 / NBRC 14942 / NCIMB 11054 / UW101) TaxID=376686 RepID=A5FN79_FLAJ1|nr:glycosyltransferase family 2 protein [Flavobacterium johnsoniae]ABQ03346.1 Candidate beta-D-/alpha-L glycosyltransferase; Glycosyltransferase family 2 [Flavobacterium johnsoniae UW101]OXG01237.1 glycosyl transferase [Flavobacterium johnsoniae UW101]WQG79789.1 glycosyltransferase family 2 protein [Flavobacterium johnsoniae UW101]SHL77903.1 Glycosyltransferase involved in cell wall bisynthesis [Flavobacterium johnsoniae]
MQFKISIITINYNNASGLEKTIESVINQTYKDFEFIVIDGGSTDESKEIILKAGSSISYWVSEKDAGIYNAMNKGIKTASGDYLLFINSGDYLYNEKVVENLVNHLLETDEIVYGNVLLRNETKNWEIIQEHPDKLNFSYFYNRTICHQVCLFKRSLFDNIFFFNEDYKIASDWEFLIYAIYIQKVNCRKIDLLISVYDTTGISGNPNFKKIAASERKKTMEKFFPLFEDDYKLLSKYSSNRSKQLLQIEKSVFFRKIVSVFFMAVLLFIPKKDK